MSAERCNLCGAALTAPESIDLGTCFPTCDDLEFDRLVAAHEPLGESPLVIIREVLALDLAAELERSGAEATPVGLVALGPIEISGTDDAEADRQEERELSRQDGERIMRRERKYRETMDRLWRDHGGEGGGA